MRHGVVLGLLLGFSVAVPGAQAQTRRELGTLTLEDVPEIPRRIVERTAQYTNTRGALMMDFDPDGDGVLLVTRFGDSAQVHHVAGPGMDRSQWTFFPEPVTNAGYDVKDGSTGFFFRMDAGGSEFYQYHWMDRATGRSTLLTDGASRNQSWLPNHNGGAVAFVSTARNKKDFDIHVLERPSNGWATAKAGAARRVKDVEGQWAPLDWSADGKTLLVMRYVSINESYLHLLTVADGTLKELNPTGGKKKIAYGAAVLDPNGTHVWFASDEDAEFLRLTRLDLATGKKEVFTPKLNWDVTQIAITRDGATLAYVVNEGGSAALYLAATADAGKATRVELPRGVISGVQFDHAGARLGLTMSTSQSSADVQVVDVKSRAVTRWTFSETGGIPSQTFVTPLLVEVPSFDKRKIPFWFYAPRTPPKTPTPVIIFIHGGPEAQATAGFDPTVQYVVNELGVAAVVPNVRGSAGYGKSYLALDNGAKREDSVKDIGAVLDWIGKQPGLDKTRVAVFGGSYGGYMVLASMTTYPERIRCGVDVVGISNFVTFLKNTEAYRQDLRRAEYGDERDPKMKALLEKISPMTNASRIKAPLFVIQGKNDPRVPVTEAEQMVATVRGNKGAVWYLVAADEGHGFQKKKNRDVLTQSVSLFFETHLLP